MKDDAQPDNRFVFVLWSCHLPCKAWFPLHDKYHDTKQSHYKVEQSTFTLIALFSLEIGRCRGRNWLNGNQALHSKCWISISQSKTFISLDGIITIVTVLGADALTAY